MYGRGFTLSNSANSSLGAPTSGPSPAGTWTKEAGFYSYYEVNTTRFCVLLVVGRDVIQYYSATGFVGLWHASVWRSHSNMELWTPSAIYSQRQHLGGIRRWRELEYQGSRIDWPNYLEPRTVPTSFLSSVVRAITGKGCLSVTHRWGGWNRQVTKAGWSGPWTLMTLEDQCALVALNILSLRPWYKVWRMKLRLRQFPVPLQLSLLLHKLRSLHPHQEQLHLRFALLLQLLHQLLLPPVLHWHL